MFQIEEFLFQNVAYRPTVYKTGIQVLVHSMDAVIKEIAGGNYSDITRTSTSCKLKEKFIQGWGLKL